MTMCTEMKKVFIGSIAKVLVFALVLAASLTASASCVFWSLHDGGEDARIPDHMQS